MLAAPPPALVNDESDFDSITACPICFECYDCDGKTAKNLSCGHYYCKQCIDTMLTVVTAANDSSDTGPVAKRSRHATATKSSASPDATTAVSCPSCGVVTAMPEGGVGKLATNYAVQDVIRIRTYQRQRNAAIASSSQNHSNQSPDIASKNSETSTTQVDPQKPKCSLHPLQEIDLVCMDCSQVPLCLQCFVEYHNGHRFSKIEAVAAEHRVRIVAHCDRLTAATVQLSQDRSAMQASMFQSVPSLRDTVSAEVSRLVSLLQDQRDAMMARIDEAVGHESAKLEAYVARCSSLIDRAEGAVQEAQRRSQSQSLHQNQSQDHSKGYSACSDNSPIHCTSQSSSSLSSSSMSLCPNPIASRSSASASSAGLGPAEAVLMSHQLHRLIAEVESLQPFVSSLKCVTVSVPNRATIDQSLSRLFEWVVDENPDRTPTRTLTLNQGPNQLTHQFTSISGLSLMQPSPDYPNGLLYVSDCSANTVTAMDPITEGVLFVIDTGLMSPRGLVLLSPTNRYKDGLLFVANANSHKVSVHNSLSGACVRSIGVTGSQPVDGRLPQPLRVAIMQPSTSDPDGRLFVVNRNPSVVKVYNATRGDYSHTFAQGLLGENPRGIAYQESCPQYPNGLLYVADCSNHRVLVLDPVSGTQAGPGVISGNKMKNPYAVTLGSPGVMSAGAVLASAPSRNAVNHGVFLRLLYVSESNTAHSSRRVQVFDALSGRYLRDVAALDGVRVWSLVSCEGRDGRRLLMAGGKDGRVRVVADVGLVESSSDDSDSGSDFDFGNVHFER